jgi:tetratricopeptide (TPR) repeat protein
MFKQPLRSGNGSFPPPRQSVIVIDIKEVVMEPQELLRQGQLLFVDGKDRESIEVYTNAIEAGADPYIAHLSRGVAYVKVKEADKALDDFTRALNTNSGSARAYFYRGLVHMMKEEFENAVGDFTKALEYKTDYAMAKFARAVSYARLKKSDEASKDMMAVVPQMEENLQSFADTHGIVRTQMWKVMAQLSGEGEIPVMNLGEQAMSILNEWLGQR